MDRREFLKRLGALGAAGLSSYFLSPAKNLFSKDIINKSQIPFDLVALHGDLPHKLFEKGIAALGGMKSFVNKNQVVVVKPNIGWNLSPERGANTNPLLVETIVEHCYRAGAKKVYVFDHTASYWKGAYQNSGIESAAKRAGATVSPAHRERYYQKVKIPGAKILKETKIHELILEADVVINVPVLKHHGGARMTSAIKNLMGVVWDRIEYHRKGLHQCIADFGKVFKPTLNVVDAYTVMTKNGPRGYSRGDLVLKQMLLISPDMVAIDAAGAKIMGKNPKDIPYIRIADKMDLGNMNLEELRIKRIVK